MLGEGDQAAFEDMYRVIFRKASEKYGQQLWLCLLVCLLPSLAVEASQAYHL